MAEFLVELYAACTDGAAADRSAERARLAAEDLRRVGIGVRFLRSIFVPEDETCLLFYEALSAADVQEAVTRAGLPFERITDVFASAEPAVSGSASERGGRP